VARPTPPRVIIVDSGLKGPRGHNLTFTSSLAEAFRARDVDLAVLGNRSADNDVCALPGFRPTFSWSAFDHPPGRDRITDCLYLRSQANHHLTELRQAVAGLNDVAAIAFLCHTLADFELLAWRDFWRLSRPEALLFLGPLIRPYAPPAPYRAVRTLRFRLSATLQPRYWALLSLRRMARRSLCVFADNQAQMTYYRRVYGQATRLVPIPVNPWLPDDKELSEGSARHARSPRIGYFGDARTTKGFHTLPDIVTKAFGRGVKAHFVIQISLPREDTCEPLVLAAAENLATLARREPEITLVQGALQSGEYENLLASVDVVLLPYEPRMYSSATSGLFVDALALGKPVLVPSGTWMADELPRTRGGLEFRAGDLDDLVLHLDELVKNLREFVDRAHNAAGAWRFSHSADRWVDIVMKEAERLVCDASDRSREV
jgi:glycosyltransferase involved in cell wall biosynthesis